MKWKLPWGTVIAVPSPGTVYSSPRGAIPQGDTFGESLRVLLLLLVL
jgi:hypothetical protein